MEWRIILPLLCLIGILHLPGFVVSQATTTPTTAESTTSTSTATTTTTATTATTTTTPTTATTATTHSTASGATTASTASGATTASTATGSASSSTGGNSTAGTNQTTTAAPPANLGAINLIFKLTDTFQTYYSDLTDTRTKAYVENIKTQFYPVYKKRYPNYFGMIINKLSAGSVNSDSILQFDTTNSTTPNATDVKDTLMQAISNGGINLTIDNSSISATAVSSNGTSTTASSNATTQTTTAATTAVVLANYNITFKIPGTFISDLSNMNSNVAGYLRFFVNSQLTGVFGSLRGFQQVDVWRFRNGSINIDALYIFIKNINAPNVSEVAKQLAAAVRNNTLFLPIDPLSINVTDILTGATASKSPMLVSMLTALWMTLASLLFSAVMH